MSTDLHRAAPRHDLPPTPSAVPPVEVRRSTTGGRGRDRWLVLGALAAAVSLTWIIFGWLAPFDGVLGFIVVSYLIFLAVFTALVALDERGPAIRDRLATVVVHSAAVVLLSTLALIVAFTFFSARDALWHLNFYTQDMSTTGTLAPLTEGGVLHAVVGTLEQIGLALSVTLPLGLVCAVFMSESRGGFSRFVRMVVEAMTALPSIVAGLFVYAALILGLKVPSSGFAAAAAISVMMLPIIIRTSEVVLRVVPASLREASLALGAPAWRTVWHVVLPTARSGLATAVILGAARGLGETSPVLVTAGFTANMNLNPFDGPQVSLPLETFSRIQSPEPAMAARGFGAAAVLMVVVLVLFAAGRIVGRGSRKGK